MQMIIELLQIICIIQWQDNRQASS